MTIALVRDRRGAPTPRCCAGHCSHGRSPRHPQPHPAREAASALAWIAAASVPVTALEEAATIRLALDACARTIAGKSAAATTQRRKRAVFHNAVSYAVELRLLSSNPIELIRWKAPAVAQTVDRRVVADPAQIRRLLTAVRGLSDRGKHLEAFYACLHYGYLRRSEAIMLKEADCRLPSRGWGRIDLGASACQRGRAAPPERGGAPGTQGRCRGPPRRRQRAPRGEVVSPPGRQLSELPLLAA